MTLTGHEITKLKKMSHGTSVERGIKANDYVETRR